MDFHQDYRQPFQEQTRMALGIQPERTIDLAQRARVYSFGLWPSGAAWSCLAQADPLVPLGSSGRHCLFTSGSRLLLAQETQTRTLNGSIRASGAWSFLMSFKADHNGSTEARWNKNCRHSKEGGLPFCLSHRVHIGQIGRASCRERV